MCTNVGEQPAIDEHVCVDSYRTFVGGPLLIETLKRVVIDGRLDGQ